MMKIAIAEASKAKLSKRGNRKKLNTKPADQPARQPANICQLVAAGLGTSANKALVIATATIALDPPTHPEASHAAPTRNTATAARVPAIIAAVRLALAWFLPIWPMA